VFAHSKTAKDSINICVGLKIPTFKLIWKVFQKCFLLYDWDHINVLLVRDKS